MIRLPSQEQPEPKSEHLEIRVLEAAYAWYSGVLQVLSMMTVALPAPEP